MPAFPATESLRQGDYKLKVSLGLCCTTPSQKKKVKVRTVKKEREAV